MNVLIAEDEEVSRLMLEFDLQTLGFDVESAEDGSDAWDKFQRGNYPLVVTDWNMPQMSGIDLVRRIREAPREEYVYLIVLTGRAEKADLIAGMEAGADDFIVKPFQKEELRVRLRAAERMLNIQHAMARLQAELKRSNSDLDQFAYAAWHDLRAPLRSLKDYLTADLAKILTTYEGNLDPGARDAIAGVMKRAEERGAAMEEILTALYEHSQVGGRNGAVRATDCSQQVRKAIANLHKEITASGSEVSVVEPLPTVPAVEDEIMRLFQNLIGNAIKYREPGKAVKVRIGARREGACWLFWVADDGIGFPPDKKETIFEAGVKSRLHGEEKYPGTGFGLAFCHKVAQRHGGQMKAESEPGKGSTFYFTLPAEQATS